MARLPRLVVPHQPHHILQRGNDRQSIFRDSEDYSVFLKWLGAAASQFNVAVHAYVLMPNHMHLLASPEDTTGIGRMMQWIGRHYVPYFNQKYDRIGTLWQGRYKAIVIDSERYFLACSRYIELNPVRAGIVFGPEQYQWSSYAHHIGIVPDSLMIDHPLYWALGNTPFQREASYREFVGQGLSAEEVQLFVQATTKSWALGSAQFKLALEKRLSRRVSPMKRGRPAKMVNNAQEDGTP